MQESLMDNETKLIPFLRELANSVETNQLNNDQIENIGDFFMSYQFQEQARKDGDETIPPVIQYSNAELVKFVAMGWYVYQVLRRNQQL
jgi:hypothetical protein